MGAIMESVTAVKTLSDYKLELVFNTGEKRVFDTVPYLGRGVFGQLRNIDLFNHAFVAYGTVCWPGNLDIAPETLYDRSTPT